MIQLVMLKDRVKNIRETLLKGRNLPLFLLVSFGVSISYYIAIASIMPFDIFLKSNSALFVALQIVLSILNAIFTAISIVLLMEVFLQRRRDGGLNVVQTFLSLFISLATTGCYICGTILVPSLGIAAGLVSLPLGGLEVKFLTLILLIYSVNDLNNKLMGICKVYKDRFVEFKFKKDSFRFNLATLYKLKPFTITFILIALIFALPSILPSTGLSINPPSVYRCAHPANYNLSN